MALRMTRLDDLNGDEDAETVTIVVNGRGVEIDLAERSMTKLVKALEPFWAAVPELRFTVERNTGRNQSVSAKQARIDEQGWDPVDVRAWGQANGVAIPTRGRIPVAIIEQYMKAVQ